MQMNVPEQFALVERGVYRSNLLHPSNFPFIKTLGLKTVLLLSAEVPIRPLMQFFDESGIRVVHLGLEVWKSDLGWRPISEELIKEGLELVLNPASHPILIMCANGIQETGTFVGCLRKLLGWNFNSILMEYQSFAKAKSRYVNELFIELFDLDLITIPKNVPAWLSLAINSQPATSLEHPQNVQ